MSFQFGFYNSIDGDRVYDADQFGDMFSGLIRDGVYATIGEAFAVTPAGGLSVNVGTGRCWFNKTWSVNTTKMMLTLAPADLLLPRYDMIVIEIDKNSFSRKNSIKLITGTPSSTPTKPTYSSSGNLFQYPIAYIYVAQNVEAVEAKDIEITVGRAPCPFVTGALQSVDITPMYQQWEQQFRDWFSVVQSTLSDDAAGTLLNMIDRLTERVTALESNRVKVSDRATEQDYLNKLDNKWISARFAATFLKAVNDNSKNAVFTSSTIFTAPSNLIGDVTATLVGGGGGGGANVAIDIELRRSIVYDGVDSAGNQCSYYNISRASLISGGGGGGSGNMITTNCQMTPGKTYSIIVGSGGTTAAKSWIGSINGGSETGDARNLTKTTSSSSSGSWIRYDLSKASASSGGSGGTTSIQTDSGTKSASGGAGGAGGRLSGWLRYYNNGITSPWSARDYWYYGSVNFGSTNGARYTNGFGQLSSISDIDSELSAWRNKLVMTSLRSPSNGSSGYNGGLGGIGGQKKNREGGGGTIGPIFPPPGGCPNTDNYTGEYYATNKTEEQYCGGGGGGYNSDAPGRVYTSSPGGYTAVDELMNCVARTGAGGVFGWGNGGSGIVILSYSVRG